VSSLAARTAKRRPECKSSGIFPKISFAEISNNFFLARKVFLVKRLFFFVNSKEWIVQLKRNLTTVASFILGIPTETATVVEFRKVKNKPLKRVLSMNANGETPLKSQVFAALQKNFSCQISG
jgi:hypothetical protein